MDLIILVLVFCFIGFVVWVITEKFKMPEGWKEIIRAVALVVIVLYVVFRVFGKYIPNVL